MPSMEFRKTAPAQAHDPLADRWTAPVAKREAAPIPSAETQFLAHGPTPDPGQAALMLAYWAEGDSRPKHATTPTEEQSECRRPAVQPHPEAAQAELDVFYDEKALAAICISVNAVADKKDSSKPATTHAAIAQILKQCASRNLRHADQVSYILATAEHESRLGISMVEQSNTFSFNEEKGWGAVLHAGPRKGTPYFPGTRSKEQFETLYWDAVYGNTNGNIPSTEDAANFRGRGFVQLTGRENYRKLSDLLNKQGFSYTYNGVRYGAGGQPLDLVTNYEHVNQVPELAARIMVAGMQAGSFRKGHSLDAHILCADGTFDAYGGRQIINGHSTDPAQYESVSSTVGLAIALRSRDYRAALADWSSVFLPPHSHE